MSAHDDIRRRPIVTGGACAGWWIVGTTNTAAARRCGCCLCTIRAGDTVVCAQRSTTGRRAAVCVWCAGLE